MGKVINYADVIEKFVPIKKWWKFPLADNPYVPQGFLSDVETIMYRPTRGPMLFAGVQGSGMTNYLRFFMQTLIRMYDQDDINLCIIDGKGYIYNTYYDNKEGHEKAPHVCYAATARSYAEFAECGNTIINSTASAHGLFVVIITGCDNCIDTSILNKLIRMENMLVVCCVNSVKCVKTLLPDFKERVLASVTTEDLNMLFPEGVVYDASLPTGTVQAYTMRIDKVDTYQVLQVPLVDVKYEDMTLYAMCQRTLAERVACN